MPTNVDLHAFHINLYWHKFLLTIVHEKEIWAFLKANKKKQNLQNRRGHCPTKLVCMHFTLA